MELKIDKDKSGGSKIWKEIESICICVKLQGVCVFLNLRERKEEIFENRIKGKGHETG